MKTPYIFLILSVFFLTGCSDSKTDKGAADTDSLVKKEVSDTVTKMHERVVVPIEGMSCMACVGKVKNTLSELNGVNEINVSLENKNATFLYNPKQITIDEIEQIINNIGYNAGPSYKAIE